MTHEDGVYFGLDEATYHADDALGSTDMRNLITGLTAYWCRSKRNPLRKPEETTPAKTRGHAIHTHILFGEKVFCEKYARALVRSDYAESVDTIDEMRKVLRVGNKAVSGSKPELAARIRECFPRVKIWGDILEAYADHRILLPADTYDEVVLVAHAIEKNPKLARAFQGGQPEVSVFWTVDGIRFKSRFDYLHLLCIGDLKTFANMYDMPIDKAVKRKIRFERLAIQACHYLNAREAMRQMIFDDKVHGAVDPVWLLKIAEQDEYEFVFTFYQMNEPLTYGIRYIRGTQRDLVAQRDLELAVERFKTGVEKFGNDFWHDSYDLEVLQDEDDLAPAW